ncbi:MAG: hypothetical protein ACRBBS_09875 [Thalassovita sp.]
MEHDEIVEALTDLHLTQTIHASLLALVLAELTVKNDGVRTTLEDVLWQAEQNAKIDIPPILGAAMPDAYRITRDLLDLVNKQLTVPLRPVKLRQ